MTASPMTDPHAGRRIFVTNWPKHPTAATPPAGIKVPERTEIDVCELADIISPLTENERQELRNAIFADASKRVNATVAELNGAPWNKWCFLTGLRYGPAFSTDVFTEEEREQLVDEFVNRAQSEGWNVREAEVGIRNGLRAATDATTNFTVRELSKIRQRDEMVAAALGTAATVEANVRTTGQLLLEQRMEHPNTIKVLWNYDANLTLFDASLAFAAASKGRVFASSAEGRLSTVSMFNGVRAIENFLTKNQVKEMVTRVVTILEPAVYAPANTSEGKLAPEKVPPGVKTIKTAVDGKRKGEVVVKTAWTCEGVADAFNAKAVLTDCATGKPKYDPETTVWLPVEKWDGLVFDNAVEGIIGTRDGVVLQELLGVFQGPQMLPNGTIVIASGLNTGHGTEGRPGHEVAFVDVGAVTGVLEPMLLERAKAVLKRYVDLFPYAEAEDAAVLVALAVTGFCRLAFKLAPLTLIDAPIYGAGKTFAAERIAELSGTAASLIACTNKSRDSGDEMRKRIETVFITGQAGFQILDDVPGGELPNVESFRTMLTANSAKCSIRVLGESRAVEVSPAKFTWVATGNNVRVSQDMVRRSVHARMDRDKAEARGWREIEAKAAFIHIKNEPKARAEVISAILSLLHHVRQNGPALELLSNFEGWSALPREVAYLVTGADPVTTQARLRANDEKAIEHAEITTALLAVIGTEAQVGNAVGLMLVREIAARISGPSVLASLVAPAALPEHIVDLRRHFGGANDTSLERRLSRWLRQHKDRRTAPDEDGTSYALVSRKLPDPKYRNKRDYWGVEVHRRTASGAFRYPWQTVEGWRPVGTAG